MPRTYRLVYPVSIRRGSEAVCMLKLTGRSSLWLFLASGRGGARLDADVRVMTLRTGVQPGYCMISQHSSVSSDLEFDVLNFSPGL